VTVDAAKGAPSDEAISAQTWLAIAAMALAVFAIANDFTAMNVVLPTLEQDLDTDLARVQWVVNGYSIVFGVLIVPGGRLADLFGRKEMLALGAAIFATFSFLAGLAPNITLLILARILMGVGGALMWPAILGLMYALLPSSKSGLAGGLVIGVAGIGNAAGPVIAGALAEVNWRYIFFLNLPIAAIAVAATWRFVHVDRQREEARIDYVGTALLSVSLLALLTALTVAPTDGFATPLVVGGFVVSAITMVGFVVRERAAGEDGLVPPSIIRIRPFTWACLAVLSMAAIFFATLFFLPQFFQKILDDGTLAAGVMLLPFVAIFAAASFGQNWLVGKIGPKAVISVGAACLFVGPLLFVTVVDQSSGYSSFVPGMIVLGVGVGLFYSAVTTAVLTARARPSSSRRSSATPSSPACAGPSGSTPCWRRSASRSRSWRWAVRSRGSGAIGPARSAAVRTPRLTGAGTPTATGTRPERQRGRRFGRRAGHAGPSATRAALAICSGSRSNSS
jgi:EmrB/QacA subfamily drug resistance transporter